MSYKATFPEFSQKEEGQRLFYNLAYCKTTDHRQTTDHEQTITDPFILFSIHYLSKTLSVIIISVFYINIIFNKLLDFFSISLLNKTFRIDS